MGSLGGLKGKAAGTSDDAELLDNEDERSSSLASMPIAEGEPPEPDPPKPPKPAPRKPPPKPSKPSEPKKPASKPPPSEAPQPPAPSGPQMVLHVAASADDDAETREIKIAAAHESVESVLVAVGAALDVKVEQLSVWDGDFDEYVTLERSTLDDLADGAKVVVNT